MSQVEKKKGREQRGEVSRELVMQFIEESDDSLIAMLADGQAQKRTMAAILLGERKYESAIQALCSALVCEKALYTRLAICEALVSIGDPAIDPLISLLGKIGGNQHCKLPERGFHKRSFPLPRDIAARTLIRMGLPVLERIAPVLRAGDRVQILEAIDVIGHLSNQFEDDQCLASLLVLYESCAGDDQIRWKILRAFQAFPHPQVTDILLHVSSTGTIAPLRWEAVRSLGFQDREYDKRLLSVLQNDEDEEVRILSKLFLTCE
jgi:HEAT repeat protein